MTPVSPNKSTQFCKHFLCSKCHLNSRTLFLGGIGGGEPLFSTKSTKTSPLDAKAGGDIPPPKGANFRVSEGHREWPSWGVGLDFFFLGGWD